jgi:predicted nucleic acid-binding protein
MKHVFVDTCYWVAITNPKDQLHLAAKLARQALDQTILHTTDEVLGEYLAHFSSKFGPKLRVAAARMVTSVLRDPNVRVHPQTRERFLDGRTLYEERPDKEYSLVDCTSFLVMREKSLTNALTNDVHFTQEGFAALIG